MAGPRTRNEHFLVGVDDQDELTDDLDDQFESPLQLVAHRELGTDLG
jgi:hypothetical protein